MKAGWNAIVARLRAEPRAAVGLAVVLLLAWFAALLEWDAAVAAQQAQVRTLQAQVARLQGLAGQAPQWTQAREEAALRLAELRARAWRAESEGRMQAQLQDWLRDALTDAGLPVRELVVTLPLADAAAQGTPESAPTLPPDMRLVRARVRVAFDPEALMGWLAALAVQERWVWVEGLRVLNQPGNQYAELELAALFVLGMEEAS